MEPETKPLPGQSEHCPPWCNSGHPTDEQMHFEYGPGITATGYLPGRGSLEFIADLACETATDGTFSVPCVYLHTEGQQEAYLTTLNDVDKAIDDVTELLGYLIKWREVMASRTALETPSRFAVS
jgi:hypothetical protein